MTSNSSNTTIIYYTDNDLSEPLFSRCQEYLRKAAQDFPIISVSHKPVNLGENICIGEQKKSWLLLYKQLLLGVEHAKTKYIATAEHDCFYTTEHFSFKPEKDDTFYYNENNCLVQWGGNHPELNGMYSRFWKQRLALSQLVCNRDLLVQTLNDRLNILDKDRRLARKIIFAGEFGLSKLRLEKAQRWAESGRPVFLKQYLQDQLDKEKYDVFRTKHPNLDVRHDRNFTGPKRGIKRCYELPYWGRFEDIMNG